MILNLVRRTGEAIFLKCGAWTPIRGSLLVAVLSTLVGLCFNFPSYQLNLDVFGLSKPQRHSRWHLAIRQVISEQITHPLTPTSVAREETGDHTEKMTFRLSMPIIGHAMRWDLGKLMLLQQLCGVYFLGMVSFLAYSATRDKVCAALLPFGFAFCYAGQACFLDMFPLFDGMAYVALASAMLFRNPLPVFLGVTFACWTDERAILVSPLVLLWWALQRGAAAERSFWRGLFRNSSAWAVAAAVTVCGVCRFLLSHHWLVNQSHSDISLVVARLQWPALLVGLASGLEWFWVVTVLGFLAGILAGRAWLAGLTMCFLLCYVGACSTVFDTTRSAAYAFPAVFVALLWLSNTERSETLRWLVLCACVLCILTPSVHLRGTSVDWVSPLFPMAFKWLL